MHERLEKVTKDHGKAEEFFERKLAFTINPKRLQMVIQENKYTIIDTRDKNEFEAGHIPNAVNIPIHDIKRELENLDKESVYVAYSASAHCHRSTWACLMLAKENYTVMELDGGLKAWTEDFGYEIVK